MASGQIDPARLEGDALRRWYLRSPDEIEEERQRGAAQTYDAFFGDSRAKRRATQAPSEGSYEEASTADSEGPFRKAFGGNARRIERQPGGQGRSATKALSLGKVQKAISSNCINCHGHFPPPPLPPPFGPFPWPIGPFPAFRDIPGIQAGEPNRDRKQCEMQEQGDRGICGQQPTEEAKAVCNEQAFKRRVHCDRTGEIGEPDLFTARRKDGRRWP